MNVHKNIMNYEYQVARSIHFKPAVIVCCFILKYQPIGLNILHRCNFSMSVSV